MSNRDKDIRSYITGLISAAVLTTMAFTVVAMGLPRATAIWIISLSAVAQVIVQLRFFLHIDLSRQKREDLQLILFSILIMAMVVGGSVWILYNQAARMM